jgi:hypothetical protein
MTDPQVTASAVLRHIAFWGDESRTRDELLELAGMIERFKDGYCPLCQHICEPSCALYPVNAEAQVMHMRSTRRPDNAVPARCDLCPALAVWTLGGSRYCDEHAPRSK